MTAHARHTIDADATPEFTACYLRVAGDECAFIEAHTAHALPKLLAALRAHGRRPEDVRYVVVTHAHLDHAAGAGALMHACPNATLLAHPKAARHLIDPTRLVASATSVYGEARFAALYGVVGSIAPARVRALADGDSFELGGSRLVAHHTAGHANHHIVIDDPAVFSVYTGDTFGLVYPALQRRGLFAMASTSPTNFDAGAARRSVAKVLSLGERFVCPTHFGAHDDAPAIAAQVLRFIDRAEAWVDEAAGGDEPLPAMQARLADCWRQAIAAEAPEFGDAERALLALDVELNAQGLAFVACARRSAGL
jgi:glyoxylase-like metal-dependent hydrolase (beta-lactamase superfamily II)